MEWLVALDPALKVVLSILSLMGAVGSATLFVIRQRKREMRAIVDGHGAEIENKIEGARRSTDDRLRHIEKRVGGLEGTVEEVDDRLVNVERSMETVARHRDVAKLNTIVGEMRGEVKAELRAVGGQVDTMYKAALAAAQNKKPEL